MVKSFGIFMIDKIFFYTCLFILAGNFIGFVLFFEINKFHKILYLFSSFYALAMWFSRTIVIKNVHLLLDYSNLLKVVLFLSHLFIMSHFFYITTFIASEGFYRRAWVYIMWIVYAIFLLDLFAGVIFNLII